jgi:hypothetical protein
MMSRSGPNRDQSTGSGPAVLGSVQPRIATSPLRDLSLPEASLGHEVVEFAAEIGLPLDPWEAEALVRGLELLPDGRLRFRIVLLLVARQNGKTTLLAVLALYWLAVELSFVTGPNIPTVLGTSNKLEHAAEAWKLAVRTARNSAALSPLIPRGGVRMANGQQTLTIEDAEYRVAAANDDAGRSLTVYLAVLDELREQATYATWDAVEPAVSAEGSMIWGLSNAGTDSSIVLNGLRADAIAALADPDTDLAILEWSAPDGSDPEDVDALAAANPNLGYRKQLGPLLAAASRAKRAGGDALAGFLTEHMCIRVHRKNPALDIRRWRELGPTADEPAQPLDGALRARTALAWDLSPDGMHATLYAAAVDSTGMVRLDVVEAWAGPDASKQLRSALPSLVRRIKPYVVGWLPAGPGASVAAELAERKTRPRGQWPPHGVKVEAVKGEITQVCMGFDELVRTGGLRHSGDPLLTAQVEQAERGKRGDAWVFVRPTDGWVDALYAAASAAHLARIIPPPLQVDTVLSVPRE